jgi:Na+-translocating ferredoxin:NAD+ oxidoreductase RnfD subunit
MSSTVVSWSNRLRDVRRFFKSPKGILSLVLGALATVASFAVGFSHTVPLVAGAVGAATLAELVLMTFVARKRSFPSGALLTGLIVAMVLSPETSPLVAAAVAAIGIGSKYVFHTKWSNVFNPAGFALVVAYFAFGTGQSWWGALPDLPVAALVVLLAAGAFVADRVNKLPMALVFLGAFASLATITVFGANPALVQELFRVPDVNAALFFALFMLDDPPTSPARHQDQALYALIAAVVSFAVFVGFGGVYYLPAGALAANVWETLRRIEERSAGHRPTSGRASSRSAQLPAA